MQGVPPRQNSCLRDRTRNEGTAMKDASGSIRTSIQGQSGGQAVAAGERSVEVVDLWRRSLKRRQKDRMTWARIDQLANEWLPPPHVLHPWPEERMAVGYPSRSRMPKLGTYGSVRGVPGDRHPYRDRRKRWARKSEPGNRVNRFAPRGWESRATPPERLARDRTPRDAGVHDPTGRRPAWTRAPYVVAPNRRCSSTQVWTRGMGGRGRRRRLTVGPRKTLQPPIIARVLRERRRRPISMLG